jgi:hypothetical protein
LNILGNATLNGNLNNLNLLQCSGDNSKILDLQGNTTVNSIVFADSVLASGTISVNGLLDVGGITFNNSNASGGTLIINTENTISVALLNAIKAKIQINANLTINHPSAGDIGDIRIADNTIYTIDSANGNVNLLNNGTKIIFEGPNSELDLINTSNTDKQFTLYANLNPSNAQDNYGIVRVGALTNGLTIANNGGPYTIGQDNTHRLKNFIVDGAGNIVVDNTVFTKLLSMNSTGQVTFNEPLDLGAGGNIAFGKDGTLVVNGVTGSVTTSANNQGTLTINSGNINGTIGSNGNSLKLVNIGANPVTFSANVFAPVALTNAGSALTLADGVILTGAITTNNNTKGILSLGVGSNVTGQIGANGAALEKINIGAGASSLGSNIYAGSTVLTDLTSALTLNNNVVVNGNITTTAGNDSGKLIFAGDGSVTGSIGANGAALEEIEFNGVDNIGGTANGAIFTVANTAVNATVTGLMTGNLNYDAAGKVTATGGLTGNIDFKNKAGTFNLGAGSTLTGTVTSTSGINGTLNVSDAGIITGNIDNLNILEFSGSTGTTLDLQGNTTVNSIVFTNNAAASGTINAGGELTLGSLTFNANATGDILVINAPSTINGAILNGIKGQIKINADLTINDPSAGEVNEIDIADNTTYTIDAKNGNVDLLKNGAKIIFEGPNSELDLIIQSLPN